MSQPKEKGPDPVLRALEILLGLVVGAMGARILWRGIAEGFDLDRVIGGGVMLAAAIALGAHAVRSGRKKPAVES